MNKTETATAPEKAEEQSIKLSLNWNIPIRSIWSAILFIILLRFTYLQMVWYVAPGLDEMLTLEKDSGFENIGLMWVPTIAYFLICISICLFINTLKNIKKYSEDGLITAMILSFPLSLIWVLIIYFILILLGEASFNVADFLVVPLVGAFIALILSLTSGVHSELK